MDRFLFSGFPVSRCKESTHYLAFAWLSGLLAGPFFTCSAGGSFTDMILAAPGTGVAATSLLATVLLPLLCSALAVYTRHIWILPALAFIKAFLFSYTASAVLTVFGSAGWLVCVLLMFTDILSLPLLWWYWQYSMVANRQKLSRTVAVAILIMAIGFLDSHFVSPFTASLTYFTEG